MLFKSKKNSPNRRKNIAKIKSPIKHSSRNEKGNDLHNSLHCLTESPNISQTFHVPYTPLTRKEKIIELKQDQEESSNRLKKYSLLFNEIKNQITSINQQITQSKHIKRGSLFDFKSSKVDLDIDEFPSTDENKKNIIINQAKYNESPIFKGRKLKYINNIVTIQINTTNNIIIQK